MEEEFDQLKIEAFMNPETRPSKMLAKMETHICQEDTSLEQIKEIGFNDVYLDEVKKGRSNLIDDVISAPLPSDGDLQIENKELSEVTQSFVSSRVSLSFATREGNGVTCSRALTNFDREVIDAVASLAPISQIMTPAMIYRVITGKDEKAQVGPPQKKRVEESMERCLNCIVKINITEELGANRGKDEALSLVGPAITYEALVHEKGRGSTTYYKIAAMPPFYRFAEKLGKISVVPLQLLDTPVSKTDNTLAMQSYLLREIDYMKQMNENRVEVQWASLYEMARQEGKKESRTENKRTREIVCKILDFWIEKDFIRLYEVTTRCGLVILL